MEEQFTENFHYLYRIKINLAEDAIILIFNHCILLIII